MSKKVDKFTFGIQYSELGKYKADGITLDNLPEGYIDKFNEATIVRAKELKAKHQDKYSDEYYLEMARKLQIRDMYGAFREIGQKSCLKCEIKDPQWAEYTYEEIIQMENDGYKVPKEILEWAHAQQQADEVNYVILTEEADFDTTTVPDVSDPKDLNELKARSMQDIAKVEKAETETEKVVNEYNAKSESAKKLQSNKEKSYKDSMDKIVNLTNEWKTLNDKQKNGTKLSNEEQKRFEELGKLLNGSNGKLTKELQIDNLELKNYLNSLNTLSDKIQYDTEIANQTIKNALELSGYMESIDSNLPFAKAKLHSDKGSTTDTLNGIRDEEISSVAMDKGKDLEQISYNIQQDLFEDGSAKLANFATEYTNIASQTENYTKTAMGDAFNKPVEDSENKNNQEDKYQIESMEFSHKNAKKAAKTSGKATLDVMLNQGKTIITDKKQKNDNKKSLKDIIKLNKETKIAEEKHKDILSEEEAFLAELEAIQPSSAGGTTEEKIKNITTEKGGAANSKSMINAEQQEDLPPEEAENTEKTEIINKIQEADQKDKGIKTNVEKALTTSIASTGKSENTSKDLTTQNNNLKQINNNSTNVAEQTLIIGAGTFAKSFITTAIGNYLFSTGLSLMPNPTTHAQGVIMNTAGEHLQKQGAKENKNGILASVAAGVGLLASTGANETNSNAKDRIKESTKQIKSNKKTFQETRKALGLENKPATDSDSNNQNIQGSQEGQTGEISNNNATPIENLGAAAVSSQSEAATQTAEEPITKPETTSPVNTQTTTTENKTENNNEDKKSPQTTGDNTKTAETNDSNENKPKDSTNTNQETAKQNITQSQDNSFSLQFSAQNSLRATDMTLASTFDIAGEQTKVEKVKDQVEKETQRSEKLINDTSKQTSQIIARHNANQTESEMLSQQLASTQDRINTASSTQEAQNAQNEGLNINDQITKVQTQDSQISQIEVQNIKQGVQQILKFKNNASDLDKNIKELNSDNAKHLELSEKAMVVGAGTGVLGASNIDNGTAMITSGISLMANILTEPEGAALVSAGQIKTVKGITEVMSGTLAFATGTAGVIASTTAQNASVTSQAVENNANTQYKTSDKTLNESTKLLNSLGINVEKNELQNNNNNEDIDNETNNNKEPEKEKLEKENSNLGLNESVIAASATSNTDIVETIETDEKNERKLTRFNEESIIESRKKKKKVVAVSASSRNRR